MGKPILQLFPLGHLLFINILNQIPNQFNVNLHSSENPTITANCQIKPQKILLDVQNRNQYLFERRLVQLPEPKPRGGGGLGEAERPQKDHKLPFRWEFVLEQYIKQYALVL